MMPAEEPPLLAEIINTTGVVTLNRPKVLNALNEPLVARFREALRQWEGRVQCVILRGAGGKAFCAGGDIKATSTTSQENIEKAKEFVRREYSLIYTIARYGAPCVALLDGITMGGGVGISIHCRYRIVTEKTVLAMPETTIGLFPDVSGSYFLSRLPGKLGLYLGLTGRRLMGKDVVKVGLGTHFVRSENIPKLFNALLDLQSGDVDSVVGRFSEDISSNKCSLERNMDVINEAFSAPTVEEILQRLLNEGSEFSVSTVKHLRRMSPISLKVTRLSIERGARMSLQECLQMEYRLGMGFFDAVSSRDVYEAWYGSGADLKTRSRDPLDKQTDIYKLRRTLPLYTDGLLFIGVRALLIDKDKNPKWNPPTIEDVTDDMVNRIFKQSPTEKEFLCKL